MRLIAVFLLLCIVARGQYLPPSGTGGRGIVAIVTSSSAPINTTETTVVSYGIPGGSIAAGTTYRIYASGVCTTSAANVSSIRVRFGSTGTSADTPLFTLAPTAATSGSTVPFSLFLEITFQSTTVAEARGTLWNNSNTGIYTTFVATGGGTNTTGLSTAGTMILQLSYGSAATTTTSTFNMANIELVKL